MIRLYAAVCRCYRKLKGLSDYELYHMLYQHSDKQKITCPNGCKHNRFHKAGTYERKLVCYEQGKIVTHVVRVSCVECVSCGKTHALLPSVIVPYCSFGLHYIIRLIYDYLNHNYISLSELCQKYDVSISTFFRMKHRFLMDWKRVLQLDAYLMEPLSNPSFFTSFFLFKSYLYQEYYLRNYVKKYGYYFMQPTIKNRV